jgi:hypothetical protein
MPDSSEVSRTAASTALSPDVDPTSGQFPGAAVTSADQQQLPPLVTDRDEHAGSDDGGNRSVRIMEVDPADRTVVRQVLHRSPP